MRNFIYCSGHKLEASLGADGRGGRKEEQLSWNSAIFLVTVQYFWVFESFEPQKFAIFDIFLASPPDLRLSGNDSFIIDEDIFGRKSLLQKILT